MTHESRVEGIDGARIVLVDEWTGEERDGVHDGVFEAGRHVLCVKDLVLRDEVEDALKLKNKVDEDG